MILKFNDLELDICDSLNVSILNNKIIITQKTLAVSAPPPLAGYIMRPAAAAAPYISRAAGPDEMLCVL